MIERLAGNVLQRFLAKYCDVENHENLTMGVWSGFIRLQDVRLKVDVLNNLLASRGIPLRVHQFHVSSVEITIPWSQLGKRRKAKSSGDTSSELVILLDGVHILASTNYEFDDEAINQYCREKRREKLAVGLQPDSKMRWHDVWRRRLQDGILQQLADQLQLHVRNVHFRLECEQHEFACGVVCESLHLQHDTVEENTIPKVAQINHFGIYVNAVEQARHSLPDENTLMSGMPASEMIAALDRSISRRMSVVYSEDSSWKLKNSPKHTYLLVPVDASIIMRFSTDPRNLSIRKALSIEVVVQEVTWSIRDFQCGKLVILAHELKEHRYRMEHFRRYRPQASVHEDPKAWWRYAVEAVRYELREHRLRWSWGRFRRRFEQRKRYCDLFERQIMSDSRSTNTNDEYMSREEKTLTDEEALELRDMDDGIRGDLGVEDILLFQAIVMKRVGPLTSAKQSEFCSSWFRRMISSSFSNDKEAEEEYRRLIAYLEDRVDDEDDDVAIVGAENMVAVSFAIKVTSGRISLYSPLPSTDELEELRRLQQEFLELNFVDSYAEVNIMGDFESLRISTTLADYSVQETRTDRTKHIFVTRAVDDSSSPFTTANRDSDRPLLSFGVEKHPNTSDDFHTRVRGRVSKLRVDLRPTCEWITKIKLLLRPFPQMQQASKFWSELSMANINSWASKKLTFAAKAQTALSEHHKMNVDIKVDCPRVRVWADKDLKLSWDLGTAVIRTAKVAGVVDARLVGATRRQSRPNGKRNGKEINLIRRDDPSLRSPSPSPDVVHSPSPSRASSIRFDSSFSRGSRDDKSLIVTDHHHVDAPLGLGSDPFDVGSVFSQSKKGSDSIFYDVYDVQIHTGTINIENEEGLHTEVILDEVQVCVSVHQSIIPADFTLCRFKVFVALEKLKLSLSESKVRSLLTFIPVWKTAIESDFGGLTHLSATEIVNRRELLPRLEPGDIDDDLHVGAGSERETMFFDAVDVESVYEREPSAMFTDPWVSDSQSVLDVETRSLSKSMRSSRRRQRSVSDLSSLSDTSLGKKKAQLQGNETYLNAENLAMLEEADESVMESNEDGSFHSAVSISQVIDVSKEVEQNIADLERKSSELRRKLDSAVPASSATAAEKREIKMQRRQILIDLEKAATELCALRTVHEDLAHQIQSTCGGEVENEDETTSAAKLDVNMSHSVKVASALVMTRKLESENATVHQLAQSGDHDQCQIWMTTESFEVWYELPENGNGYANTISFDAHKISAAFRQSLLVTRALFGVERCGAQHTTEVSTFTFLSGGASTNYAGKMLPSLFPQFFPSTTTNDKLLHGTIEVTQKKIKQVSSATRLVKARVAVGDIEVILKDKFVEVLCVEAAKAKSPAQPRVDSLSDRSTAKSTITSLLDCATRLSSCQIFIGDDTTGAAVSFGGLGTRCLASKSPQTLGDRLQGQIRCENILLIGVSDFPNGLGVEVISKQDLYSPIVELNIRAQVVPGEEPAGWVVDGLHCNYEKNGAPDECLNLHVTLKIDCIESNVSLSTLKSLHRASSTANRFKMLRRPDSSVHVPSGATKSCSSLLSGDLRWRIDLDMGKSLLMLQSSTVYNDCSTLLATTSLRAAVLPSYLSDGRSVGVTLQAKFDDTSLSVVTAEDAVLSPLVASIACDLPLGHSPRRENHHYLLNLPAQHAWSFDIPYQCSAVGDADLKYRVSVSVTPVEVNLWLTGLLVVRSLCRDLATSFADGKEPSDNAEPSLPAYDLAVDVVSVRVNVLAAPSRLPSSPANSNLAFIAQNVSLQALKSTEICSGRLIVTRVSLHEINNQKSIRVFIGARLKHEKDAPNSEDAFLSITWKQKTHSHSLNSSSVELSVGTARLLLIPSSVTAVVAFVDAAKVLRLQSSRPEGAEQKVELGSYRASFHCEMLEVLLPSQDLSHNIRDSSKEDVGVVVFRLRPKLKMKVVVSSLEGVSVPQTKMYQGTDVSPIQRIADRFLHSDTRAADIVLVSEIDFSSVDIQMLRTAVQKCSCHILTKGIAYEVSIPAGSEQRVTNRFRFEARLDRVELQSPGSRIVSAASLQVKFGLIDILVYISQSAGGLTDAIKSTVLPSIVALQVQTSSNEAGEVIKGESNVISMLVNGPFIATILGEGVNVTCVPGGATRLTESPIAKLVVSRLSLSTAAVSNPAPKTTGGARDLDFVSCDCLVALQASFEVSAYYHNRRLVVWEPLIEPWEPTASLRFRLKSKCQSLQENMDGSTTDPETPQSSRVTSLRSIGRILRSPFINDEREELDRTSESIPRVCEADFCYVLLSLSVPDRLLAAFAKPSVSALLESTISIRPTEHPERWLQLFVANFEFAKKSPDLTFTLADRKPLNLNVTGALLELLFEFVTKSKLSPTEHAIPHMIRNETGLTVRFQEVLESERVDRGEKVSSFTLASGMELPLSLRRSLSQSCDPHKGFISIELGNYSDTVGRVKHDAFPSPLPQPERFYFKTVAKIPVDTVGFFRFPMDWNILSDPASAKPDGSPGSLLVRVVLRGSSKVVTLESPLVLRNVSVSSITCEARDESGVLWTSTVPSISSNSRQVTPVPLDLVSYAHERCSFTISDAAIPSHSGATTMPVRVPRPFSRRSLQRGVIDVTDVKLPCVNMVERNVNVCGIRLGTFSLEQLKARGTGQIPEQRMLLFRSQVIFWNHLAFPCEIQVRVRSKTWSSLGNVGVGHSVGWDGADPYKTIEIRIRMMEKQGVRHSGFPAWSTPLMISPASQDKNLPATESDELEIIDKDSRTLSLKVRMDTGHIREEGWWQNESHVGEACRQLEAGGRVFHIFAPYWVVDSTGLNLEYRAGSLLTGQHPYSGVVADSASKTDWQSLGLHELLHDQNSTYLGMQASFHVLMIGKESSSQLQIRCNGSQSETHAPWSEPIALRTRHTSCRDVYLDKCGPQIPSSDRSDLVALRVKMVKASRPLGGHLGTRLLHVYCRYAIQNDLGRDVEVRSSGVGTAQSIVIPGDCKERAFHTYESRSISFRPTGFGWEWSGHFRVLSDTRKELTFVLKHKMRDEVIHVNVECFSRSSDGTCVISLRPALHLPYRIENASMVPLQFHQKQSFFTLFGSSFENGKLKVILPFHSADFAWERPESRHRKVVLCSVDFGSDNNQSEKLGVFALDDMIPGSKRELPGGLTAVVVSDGPTRVLRVIESTKDPRQEGILNESVNGHKVAGREKAYLVQFKLTHGVGLSLVNWKPEELLYLRLYDIGFEVASDGSNETIELAIASIVVDNCLWVTPYPVALRVGSRNRTRRKRRNQALTVRCGRSRTKQAEFEDLTLIQRLEIASQPSILSVDGKLAENIIGLIRKFRKLGQEKASDVGVIVREHSRNEELRGILQLDTPGTHSSRLSQDALLQDDLYRAVDTMATTAIAAKLRTRYRAPSKLSPSAPAVSSEPMHQKFYVEKLRVSTTTAQLSWSGALPVALSLPRWMRPSLTFEGFPLFLRPYTATHSYGTAEEHIVALKSHYLSLWRVLDLLVGTARPIFIVRAWYFTTREILASYTAGLSCGLESSADSLIATGTRRVNTRGMAHYYNKMVSNIAKRSSKVLRSLSSGLAVCSNALRYDSAYHIESGGLVRARNPRLFAQVEGKEMLVEYTEGENDGKALLSRVRMGVHLGEGYLHHLEALRWDESRDDAIFMVTYERIMLLVGMLNSRFCQVIWEIRVKDLVRIETIDVDQSSQPNGGKKYVRFWYIDDNSQSTYEEKVLLAHIGLDLLRCRTVTPSISEAESLVKKLLCIVHPHVFDQ